jgi:HPt (histidine-containing phosphotransfer) domain-containing protein
MAYNGKESFVSNEYEDKSVDKSKDNFSSNELLNMFDSLEHAEQRCKQIESDLDNQEELDSIKHNESTFNELDELDKKITELKEILRELSTEKMRKDSINNQCQKDTQVTLNKNYDLLNKLNNKGLIPSENINLDLNISDALKNKYSNEPSKVSKCQTKNSKDYVNIDKDIKGKCYGCDVDSLKKNLQHLNSDFKP